MSLFGFCDYITFKNFSSSVSKNAYNVTSFVSKKQCIDQVGWGRLAVLWVYSREASICRVSCASSVEPDAWLLPVGSETPSNNQLACIDCASLVVLGHLIGCRVCTELSL